MANEPKQIKDPISFLRETGLLFEINRKILHPYGLALAVYPSDDPEVEVGSISIMDSRDEKEGYLYGEDTYLSGLSKISEFNQSFGNDKLIEREEEIGYIVQDTPDPHIKKNGVTIITYNPAYTGGVDDFQDDNNLLAFRVPFDWLTQVVRDWYDMTIPQFLDFYSYDNSQPVYDEAKKDGVIIQEDSFS
jgi:hypothetical protein